MKKQLLTLLTLSVAVSAHAAPEKNTFYVGAKAGWASFHDGLTQFDHKNGGGYGVNRNSVTYGVFGGYQAVKNGKFGLATEIGYEDFGRVRGNGNIDGQEKRLAKHTAHGTHFNLKPSYEIAPRLDVYGKVGIALIRNDYYEQKTAVNQDRLKSHVFKPSLSLGAGLEYELTDNLSTRVEYQYINKVGNLDKAIDKANGEWRNTQYSPNIHTVNAGIVWRFGGKTVAPVEPIVEKPLITKNFSFNSDVLFDLGKWSLKEEAKSVLNDTNKEINNLALDSKTIMVKGHADRLGKDDFNIGLSRKRAESVAAYLIMQGQPLESVSFEYFGSTKPNTGDRCNKIKNKKALVSCLAPDRRVEVEVNGTKQVTE